jgi:hypothetical protein
MPDLFSSDGFLPHGHCCLWQRGPKATQVPSPHALRRAFESQTNIKVEFRHANLDRGRAER